MKHIFGERRHWQNLDLEKMPYWPNAPRRWVLTLFGVILFILVGVLWLWPRLDQLHVREGQIQIKQQEIVEILRAQPLSLDESVRVRKITRAQEGGWLAGIAGLARDKKLKTAMVKVRYPDENERNDFAANVQEKIQKDPRLVRQVNFARQSGWENSLGVLEISVQGAYANVVDFVSELGAREEWLAIQNIELDGVDGDQVSWSAVLWFYKEAENEAR